MKFKVTYYDYDSGKSVTKDCYRMNSCDGKFEFIPVDDPIKIYKSLSIDHPIVSIYQNETGLMVINVVGYQWMKSSGYGKTTTIIENVRD
jgi:hypothetical protein